MELKDYLSILKRRFGWCILTFAIGGLLYGYAYFREPLTFSAKAQLLVQFEVAEPIGSGSPMPIRSLGITAATREQLLRSEETFEAAVLIRAANKHSQRTVTTLAEAKTVLADSNDPLISDADMLAMAVQEMMSLVTVSREGEYVQLVEVAATVEDPQAAIEMVNAHALACEDLSRREVLGAFEAALNDINRNLMENARRQQELQRRIDEIFDAEIKPSEQLPVVTAEIGRIRERMRTVQAAIAEVDSSLHFLLGEIHCRTGLAGDSDPTGLDELDMSPYTVRMMELQARLDAALVELTEEAPEVKKLRAELEQYKQTLPRTQARLSNARIDELRRTRRKKMAEMQALEKELNVQLAEAAKVTQRYAEYTPLKRELEMVMQDAKDLLSLKRRCELHMSVVQPYVTIRRLASKAVPMGRKLPASPIFWLLSTAIIGILVAYVREYLDTSIATEYDIRRHLNLPVFAIVPYITGERLSFLEGPHSALAETFNATATLIRAALLESGFNCLGVCSANPKEGKTTVSINLAVAFARKGVRTLLIDADMRCPQIHNLLKLDNSRGLSTILGRHGRTPGVGTADPAGGDEKKIELTQYLLPTVVENLFVLPSGPLPSMPTALIETRYLEDLFSEAKKTMDMVIVDTPPICTVSDALTIAAKVDANMFVVGSELSEQREVHWAKHLLTNVHARLLGVILNMARRRAHSEYYYYYYRGGYKKVKERT